MSKGPGVIERRIVDLFAATRDRALSVSDITDAAFELGGRAPTRVQRLSACRAAHRLQRRMRDTAERCKKLRAEARRNTAAALGYAEPDESAADPPRHAAWIARLRADLAYLRAEKLSEWGEQFGTWTRVERVGRDRLLVHEEFWRATIGLDRALYFHPPDVPVRIWAVSMQHAGLIWADAEVVRITERNVMVSYAGEIAVPDSTARHWRASLLLGVGFLPERLRRRANRIRAAREFV